MYAYEYMQRYMAQMLNRQLTPAGKPILPHWWVFECLFEYERDAKGNRGTDVESERLAYFKSKVTNKMREGRARLAPKLSEYSSRCVERFLASRRRDFVLVLLSSRKTK